MTDLLSGSQQVTISRTPTPVRWKRWTAGWRVALRLARRDAVRAQGRSLLVVLLIALPVAGVSALDLYARAEQLANSPSVTALRQLGDSADAVVRGFSGPISQGIMGSPLNTGNGTTPSREELQSKLPQGSRLVSQGVPVSSAVERDGWGVLGDVWMANVADPLVRGLWRLREGRLPTAGNEITLTQSAASRLRARIGDTITITALGGPPLSQARTIVGLVAEAAQGGVGVVVPGALPTPATTDPASQFYLAAIPRDLTWSDVRKLNAIGGLVVSRSVLMHPPTFCAAEVECLDAGPRPGSLPPVAIVDSAAVAKDAALSAVVTVLVIIQVALLAGPAFAVSLRRRQRELGLLGAVGGDSHDLRRTMLASGVVLGLSGALLGLILGWGGTWIAGRAHVIDLGFQDFQMPQPPPELLGLLLVGITSAVAAALAPAVSAARSDVLSALRGRRPGPPTAGQIPISGLVLGLVGLAGMYYGTATLEPVILVTCVVIAELGFILVMPSLVTSLARTARHLPLAPRIAVRDAGRHRMRSTAAACAIAAAAAGSVGVAALSLSNAVDRTASDVTWVGGTILSVPLDQTTGKTPDDDTLNKALKVASDSIPGATIAEMTELMPVVATDPYGGDLVCVMPGEHLSDGSTDIPCSGRGTSGLRPFNSSIALIQDPGSLPAVLGPLAPNAAAISALRAGEAVVLTPGTLDADSRLSLRERSIDTQGTPQTGQLIQVPAMEIAAGAVPINVIVGPAALTEGMPLSGHVKKGSTTIVVHPKSADSPDRPTNEDTLNLAWAKAGLVGFQGATWTQGEDTTSLVLALATGITALMALLAALISTGLTLVDGRADLATLAAIGAQPHMRRAIAASTAGFISLIGCVTGALTGLVASRLLVPLFTKAQGSVFVTPWAVLGLTIVVIPLAVAGIAWLFTRSHIAMTRRLD